MNNLLQNYFNLPLDYDYSWVQILTGIHWLIAGTMAFTSRFNKNWFWILFSSFLICCAIDEMFMVHECCKYGFYNPTQFIIKDFLVLIYGIASIVGGSYFYLKFIHSAKQRIVLFIMMTLVFVIVANDVFNLSFFELANSAEECAELMLTVFTIYFIQTFPLNSNPKNKLYAVMIVVFFIVTGFSLRTLLWPQICPKVLDF